MKVLVTGGAGYIGSHTCIELIEAGYETIVMDNLCNSSEESVKRVEKITGKKIKFYNADVTCEEDVEDIFNKEDIGCVIHFAGLKAVAESVEKPIEYYRNNINGTLVLCDVMRGHGVKQLVFSSSATVYGDPASLPIKEDFPLSVTNPYGRSKLIQEKILKDIYVSDKDWGIVILRYFNPVGAHESGMIGDDPKGKPKNIAPYITKTAAGVYEKLEVTGNDYDTLDGTGVRDYIHVKDLAQGHVSAIKKLQKGAGIFTYNLGTGNGISVLEMIQAFEKAGGTVIAYEFKPRRPGDIGSCYADPSLAEKELGWKAVKTLDDMCRDAWRWQEKNPNGYDA